MVMKNHEIKVALVLLGLLLTLGLLVGGQKIYRADMVEKPVVKQLLALPCVDEAVLCNDQGRNTINVHMQSVDNLKQAYNEIDQIMAAKFPRGNYGIVLDDQRNAALQNEWEQLELALYEAIASNQYVALEQHLNAVAARNGFTCQLQIDTQHLFVHLQRGEQFLYEIIERQPPDSIEAANGEKS